MKKTSERLTGRAGLVFFVAYLNIIEIFALSDRFFGKMRKKEKDVTVVGFFKQVLCFMVEGTVVTSFRNTTSLRVVF